MDHPRRSRVRRHSGRGECKLLLDSREDFLNVDGVENVFGVKKDVDESVSGRHKVANALDGFQGR